MSSILIILRVFSMISCFLTLFLIFFYLFSTSLHKITFYKIIFYIAICDFFSSIGFFIGFPNENTIECNIQALLINIFPLSTVFWITIISYMLYINVFKREVATELLSYKVYFICWIFP